MIRFPLRAAGLAFCLLLLLRAETARALDVFACEPEWAALAQELGGNAVTAVSATTARQDPHQIQARPSLIARLRNAGLVVCTGAELEIGWMPILLRQSANPRIQPNTPGYFEAARQVRLLEVPAQLDRAMGDVHAAGNPHLQTDPRNIAAVATALSARMQQLDPANAATIARTVRISWRAGPRRRSVGRRRQRRCGEHRLQPITSTGPILKTGSACVRWRQSSRSPVCRRAVSISHNLLPSCRPGAFAEFSILPTRTRAPRNLL